MSSFASVSAGRTAATRVLAAGFGAVARARREHRGAAADARRDRAAARRAMRGGPSGESRELFNYVAGDPTRRRCAGGETLDRGAFAEATADLGRADSDRRRAASTIGRSATAICSRRRSRRARCCATTHDAKRDGWLPTARGGMRCARRRRLQPPLGGLSRLADADAQRAVPAVPRRAPMRPRPTRTSKPERLAGVEAGLEYAHGPLRLSADRRSSTGCSDAIANVTLGKGPGTFPGVGFVGAGGTYPRARECRCGEGARASKLGGMDARAVGVAAPARASPMRAWRRAARRRSSMACARRRRPSSRARWRRAGSRAARARELVLRRVGAQFEDDLNTRRAEGRDDARRVRVMAARAPRCSWSRGRRT